MSATFNAKKIEIPVKSDTSFSSVKGFLNVPENPKGVVVFAHGSGSGRHSLRNQYVARILNQSGFATALADLLTEEEGIEDEKSKKLRFDIKLLSGRLVAITDWVVQDKIAKDLSVGYYGASTGAAAALNAAAEFQDVVKALVSRGGRVDLATSVVHRLDAGLSILLLVGSNDPQTINWNQRVLQQLKQVANKRLCRFRGLDISLKKKARWKRLRSTLQAGLNTTSESFGGRS